MDVGMVCPRFLTILLCLFFVACSRPSDNSSAKISLSFSNNGGQQKAGALSSSSVNVIILNITGPGISTPIFYQWSRMGQDSAQAPAYVELEVPKGDGRLVQALIVREDANGLEQFMYGDSIVSVSAESTPVGITVAVLGSSTATDGRIAGRWVDATNNGPTGRVSIYYPVPGKPKMLIDSSEIHGGWFSVLALEGVGLEHKLSDGNNLFPLSATMVNSPELHPAGDLERTVRVKIPAFFESYEQDGSNREPRGAQRSVFGYWGPGAVNKKVCWKSAYVSLSNAYRTSNEADTSRLQWAPSPGDPWQLGPENVNGQMRGYATPSEDADEFCTGPTGSRFDDYIALNPTLMTHNDESAGFRGVFQMRAGMGGYQKSLATDFAAPNLVLDWRLLPGVTSTTGANRIDGVDIFARANASPGGRGHEPYYTNSGIACDRLNSYNFSLIGFKTKNVNPLDLDYSLTISPLTSNLLTAMSTNGVTVIACPYANPSGGSKKYFEAAATAHISGGMMMGPQNATSFIITGPQSPGANQIAHTVCTPFQIEGMNGANPAQLPMGSPFNFSTSDPTYIKVYSDPYCGIQMASGMPPGGSTFKFYVKSDANDAARTISVTHGSIGSPPPLVVNTVAVPGSPVPQLRVSAPTNIYAHTCYSITGTSWHNDGANSLVISFGSQNFNWPGGIGFYYDGDCTMTSSTSYLMSGHTSFQTFFKYTGVSATIDITPSNSNWDSISGTYSGTNPITVTQPGAITQLQFHMPMNLEHNRCERVNVVLADSSGHPTPAPSGKSITFSSAGGSFYTDPSCTSPTTSTSIAAALTSSLVYYMPSAAGTATLQASLDGTGITKSLNLPAGVMTAYMIATYVSSQTFTPGVNPPVSGMAKVPKNTSFNIELRALKRDFTIDTNFNQSLSSISTSSMNSAPTDPNTVIFTNGVATVSVASDSSLSGSINGSSFSPTNGPMNFSMSIDYFSPAQKFNIYMDSPGTLKPGTCQIFAIVPEDNFGYARPAGVNSMVNIATTNGTVYSDKNCTISLTNSFNINFSDSEKLRIYFFKGDASTSGTITTTYNATIASVNTTVAAGGAPGSATKWKMLGLQNPQFTDPYNQRCMPYIVHLSDANDQTVFPGADITNVRVRMGYISATTGAFTAPIDNCTTNWLDVQDTTLFASMGYLVVVGFQTYGPSTQQTINVQDNYPSASTYTAFQAYMTTAP